MHIIIIAATQAEFEPAMQVLKVLPNADIMFHVTGIGMLATAVSVTKLMLEKRPDLVIQVGIAGTFDTNIELGKVVIIKAEYLGDIGVQETGVWKDIFDLNLVGTDNFPFKQKAIINPYLPKLNVLKLQEVAAVTINEISTNSLRIEQLKTKYNPIIESMEGAAMHYVCTDLQVPFLQIRSVSNYIGERDKTKWQMKAAISNLNKVLIDLITYFQTDKTLNTLIKNLAIGE